MVIEQNMNARRPSQLPGFVGAPDDADVCELPPRFAEARDLVRDAIARAEAGNVPTETLLAVLMSETLPRMVHLHGPGWVAVLLAQLAHQISFGIAPNCAKQ